MRTLDPAALTLATGDAPTASASIGLLGRREAGAAPVSRPDVAAGRMLSGGLDREDLIDRLVACVHERWRLELGAGQGGRRG